MRKAIQMAAEGRIAALPDFGELSEAQAAIGGLGVSAECSLLTSAGKALSLLRGFAHSDRLCVRDVLDKITHGQELDLVRFGSASVDRIAALENDAELDDYTYSVAGCVGEFWTKMCRAHLFSKALLNDAFLFDASIRFGKGLQLVNILRDLPKDLRQGRCYIPGNRLADCGLQPQDLLDPAAIHRLRPLYDSYLQQAEDYLYAGWSYTRILPLSQMRVRLACALPILIGIRTLARLRVSNVLDDRHLIKTTRSEVRWLLLRTVILYPRPIAWNRLFDLAKEE